MGNIFTHLPFSVSISIAELYFCNDKLTLTMKMEVLEECVILENVHTPIMRGIFSMGLPQFIIL